MNYNEKLEPQFYADNKSFWVTQYNLNYDVPIEKVAFDNRKVDFRDKKVDTEYIESCLSDMKVNLPTKEKVKMIFLKFGTHKVFSRKEIVELLKISPTSASVLMTKLDKAGLLEAVAGQGKGKYKFK